MKQLSVEVECDPCMLSPLSVRMTFHIVSKPLWLIEARLDEFIRISYTLIMLSPDVSFVLNI